MRNIYIQNQKKKNDKGTATVNVRLSSTRKRYIHTYKETRNGDGMNYLLKESQELHQRRKTSAKKKKKRAFKSSHGAEQHPKHNKKSFIKADFISSRTPPQNVINIPVCALVCTPAFTRFCAMAIPLSSHAFNAFNSCITLSLFPCLTSLILTLPIFTSLSNKKSNNLNNPSSLSSFGSAGNAESGTGGEAGFPLIDSANRRSARPEQSDPAESVIWSRDGRCELAQSTREPSLVSRWWFEVTVERTDVARLISRDGRGGGGPVSDFAEAIATDAIAELSLNGEKEPMCVSLLAKKVSNVGACPHHL